MAWRATFEHAVVFIRAFLGFARWRAAGAALLIGLGALADGVGLLVLVPVLDLVTGPQGGRGLAGRLAEPLVRPLQGLDPTGRPLVLLLAAFVALMAVRGLLLSLRDRSIDGLKLEFVEAMRMRLVGRLAAPGWRRVAGVSHARIVQALSIEIHQIGIAANSALLSAVAVVMLSGQCALALILAPVAAPVAITFALLGAVVTRAYLTRAGRLGRAITEAHYGMTSSALSFLNGLKLAVAQGLQDVFVREYAAAATSALRDRLQFASLQSDLRNVTTTLAAVVGAATLLLGVAVFRLPPSVLITLLLVLSRMSGPALTLQTGVQQILHSLPAFGVIQALEAELADDEVEAENPTPTRDAAPGDPIVFSKVTFRRAAAFGRPAELETVNLAIPAGAFVGVVGPSGAGKTTFLDLVAGLLTPQSGRISVHGRELSGAALADHREDLAYVAQDAFLFDDTVRRNLAWSRPGCSEAEMREALEFVGAGPLLKRLEHGLDTCIGEHGALVSAGERQRLALARALLRRPRLLALDEATNAIDVASERLILERLVQLTPETTILMVAHRAESLALCDYVLTFPGPSLLRVPKTGVRAASGA